MSTQVTGVHNTSTSTSAAKAIFAPESKIRRHGHANTGTVAVSALDYYTQVLSGPLLQLKTPVEGARRDPKRHQHSGESD
ncbi:hypothetical protein DPMN_094713 [Dreissena polymorpha]|uniref:Uncharacterized protein n=1 Tax=Dreissena polymorpha TaxID=45954 RepID=A0A9D4R333_DREPO|nr:hypothetical protein DPMN_094713 [Dreissena polymorpha]